MRALRYTRVVFCFLLICLKSMHGNNSVTLLAKLIDVANLGLANHSRMSCVYTLGNHVSNQLRFWRTFWRQSYNFAVRRIGWKAIVCSQWSVNEPKSIKPVANMFPRNPHVQLSKPTVRFHNEPNQASDFIQLL